MMSLLLSWAVIGAVFLVGAVMFLVSLLEAIDPLGRGQGDRLFIGGFVLLVLALLGAVVRAVLWLLGVPV